MSEVIKNRVEQLRAAFKTYEVDGFLVPQTDEFGSEYLSADVERLAWITGFTGSSGAAIVLSGKAMVMTDGRYTIQIKNQVDSGIFEICDMADVTIGGWLAGNAPSNSVIGYDPKLHTRKQIETISNAIKESGVTLKPLKENTIDVIWTDRPESPMGIVELFPNQIAGQTSIEKCAKIAAGLRAEKISSVIVTLSDSICWLLNVRGDDIEYNPLVLSYAIFHTDTERVDWFVDNRKIPSVVRVALEKNVTILPFEDFAGAVSRLSGVVQYDDERSSIWISNLLEVSGIERITGKDPCIAPKATKSPQEQVAIRTAHLRDGVALTRLLFWLEAQDLSDGHVTEISVADKLEELRRGHESYRGKSFNTIAGWADHGAIIHYHATADSNAVITDNSFLLLDSGGQYEYGTTDVTRTIVVGEVTPEMKDRYTRVLKGHIALASARFAAGTEGAALDNLARQPLIDEGLNFAHGTGHGVGCFLCVHEEAASISPRGKVPLRAGMLVSNEPGYYKEGDYGIRHENLILCQEDSDDSYTFDSITMVPFDRRGIDWDLMTDAECEWLHNYHIYVFENISPFLEDVEVQWLHNFLFPDEEDMSEEMNDSFNSF